MANNQSVITGLDVARSITLSGSDTDGDTLSYSIVTSPVHGTLTGTAPNVTYTPATGYSGADSFTFEVQDKSLVSNVATVSITVVAPPTSTVAALPAVINSTSFTLSWSGTDSPGGGGIVFYSIYESEDKGPFTALLSNTAATSTTVNGAYGHSYGFFSVATDAEGFTQSTPTAAQASTTLQAASAPVATGQSVVTGENDAKAITLSASDTDGASLSYKIETAPAHGTLTGTAPDLVYTPASGYSGADSFTFEALDGTVASNVATVSIAVVAPPASSIAALPAVTSTTSFTLSWSGTDSAGGGGIVSYSIYDSTDGGPFSALLTNTTATSTTFTGAFGHSYGFYSVATDAAGFTQPTPAQAQATTTLEAAAAPVAAGQSVVTGENNAKAITLSATDTDGDALSYSIVTAPCMERSQGLRPT